MSLRQWLRSLDSRQWVAILAVAVLVLSAGCLGLGDSGDDGTEMDDNGSVDDPGENTDDNNDDENDGVDQERRPAANASAWLSQFDFDEPADGVTATVLVNDTLATLDGVESYEYTRRTNVLEEAIQQDREAVTTADQKTVVDSSTGKFQFSRTVESPQLTFDTEGYLSNGTYYQRDTRSDAGWVRQDLNSTAQLFAQYDAIASLRTALENNSVSLEGTTSIDNETAHLLSIDVSAPVVGNETSGSQSPTITESEVVVWISDSSTQVLRSASFTQYTRSTNVGEVETTVENEFDFEYGAVDISLPPGAQNATEAGN